MKKIFIFLLMVFAMTACVCDCNGCNGTSFAGEEIFVEEEFFAEDEFFVEEEIFVEEEFSEESESPPTPTPEPTPEPLPTPTVDLDSAEEEILEEPAPPQKLPSVYTVEQIQIALHGQFQMSGWSEIDTQVISVQRVVRDSDVFWHEPAREYIDISNSARYRVAVRFEESLETYNRDVEYYVANPYWPYPFVRDGDYTILTQYYYFNDENGTPVLAFIMC